MVSRSTEAAHEEIGGYRVRSRIAIGGMSEIFAAESADGTRVALKVLLPQLANTAEGREAFAHEAELGERLTHAHIVRVLGHGDDTRGPYLVLEWIDGASLAACKGSEPLPIEAVLVVAADVLGALELVHQARDANGEPLGIVHRDLSPDNLMITRTGEVKLTDFGIARSRLRDKRTKTGFIRGKAHYLSPEQITGSEVDARADLYGLGCVLFELATQETHIDGDGDLAVLRQAEAPTFRAPSSLGADAALDGLLERALARFPEDRFQSARSMRRQVESLLAVLGEAAVRRGRDGLRSRAQQFAQPFPLAPVVARQRPMSLLWPLSAAAAVAVIVTVTAATNFSQRASDDSLAATGIAPLAQGSAAAPIADNVSSTAAPALFSARATATVEPSAPLSAATGQSTKSAATEVVRSSPSASATQVVASALPSSTPSAPSGASANAKAELQSKMNSVSQRLKRAKADGRDVSALEARSAIALQAFLDGRYEDTDRELDTISAALPP